MTIRLLAILCLSLVSALEDQLVFRVFASAQSANIIIARTSFLHGRNPTQSLVSKATNGGVLGCVNCPQVSIHEAETVNVTSKVGGGFSFRSDSTQEATQLSIAESYFARCRATRVAALFIQNAAYVISDCRFLDNAAESVGGAMQVSTKPVQYRPQLHLHRQ